MLSIYNISLLIRIHIYVCIYVYTYQSLSLYIYIYIYIHMILTQLLNGAGGLRRAGPRPKSAIHRFTFAILQEAGLLSSFDSLFENL